MTIEEELHNELLSLHRRTGEATGYWPHYFLREVRAKGGLSVARALLAPGEASSGFDRLVEARRADLSVEYIATSERFSRLFSSAELHEARHRLDALPDIAFPTVVEDRTANANELDSEHVEGTARRVLVNRYERDPRAREACIRHHGARCAVCGFDFGERYGDIGQGFIHVHHSRPLSRAGGQYRVNPKRDLVPVCPNCHEMLHRRDPPYDVEQLRARLQPPA